MNIVDLAEILYSAVDEMLEFVQNAEEKENIKLTILNP